MPGGFLFQALPVLSRCRGQADTRWRRAENWHSDPPGSVLVPGLKLNQMLLCETALPKASGAINQMTSLQPRGQPNNQITV